jgi:hypothetical protein
MILIYVVRGQVIRQLGLPARASPCPCSDNRIKGRIYSFQSPQPFPGPTRCEFDARLSEDAIHIKEYCLIIPQLTRIFHIVLPDNMPRSIIEHHSYHTQV